MLYLHSQIKVKIMKKLFLGISALGLSFFSVANAQTTKPASGDKTGFYIGVGGGYSLPLKTSGESEFFSGYDEHRNTDGSRNYKSRPFSFGQGANFGIDLGYMFTPNIGAELGVDYFMGSKIDVYKYSNDSSPNYSENQKVSAKMIQLKPAVVFKAGSGKVNPYTKLGVIIGVGGKITSEYSEKDSNPSNNYSFNIEMSEGTAFGLHGALGLEYAVNDKISLFGEIAGNSLNYSPKKGKVTKWGYDTTNYLEMADIDEKEFEFVDEYKSTDNANNKPRKMLKFSTPFSNIGLNIGAKFHF